jgi:hypothetical protein
VREQRAVAKLSCQSLVEGADPGQGSETFSASGTFLVVEAGFAALVHQFTLGTKVIIVVDRFDRGDLQGPRAVDDRDRQKTMVVKVDNVRLLPEEYPSEQIFQPGVS